MPSEPKWMQRFFFSVRGGGHKAFRDNGIGTAGTGKSCSFWQASEFNGYFTGSFNFKDRMRDIPIGDISLIGSIKQNDGFVLKGVFHPLLQFLSACCCSGRIVGVTQENNIYLLFRDLRDKIILSGTGHIYKPVVITFLVVPACTACHHACIHIYRVYGILHGNDILLPKNLEDVACVAFRPIGNKNLVGLYVRTATLVFALCNGVAEKIITLFGTVSFKGFNSGHLFHTFMKCTDNRRGKRLGDIANSHLYDISLRIFFLEFTNAPSDFREQVPGL